MDQENDLVGVKVAMERHMESLYKQAMDVAEAYYGFRNDVNKRMDWSKKSTLVPRVRRRGLSIAAEWYNKRWYGRKVNGARRLFTTYITKPRAGHGYTLSKLLEYTQD